MFASRRWCAAFVFALTMALAARADDAPPATPPPASEPTPAAADTAPLQIGRSIFIANQVDGKFGDAPEQHVKVNDDIVFEEDITTGSDAKAILEFRDGSTFEIGPDAAVRIDSFVFNPEESTSHKTIQVTRGVFRYVSAYVAGDQETKIATPSGQMGIRGSVAAGVVDPAVPDFIYLGEGNATFTNSAGSSTLQPGNSIAVPSATTPPMAGDAMPAPIAAQALQAIEKRLPPRNAIANRPPADDAWLKRAGSADLVPAAEQQRAAASAATNRPLPTATGTGVMAGELGLLTEANRLNMFNGRQGARTPEQTAFMARVARENPGATAAMRRFNDNARVMHTANITAGNALVMRGVGHAAPSAEVMRRVTEASVRANPAAAAAIRQHASQSYRGADHADFSRQTGRPETGRPEGQRPSERGPNAAERRETGQRGEQGQRQQGQRGEPNERDRRGFGGNNRAQPQVQPHVDPRGLQPVRPPQRPAGPPPKGQKKRDDQH
jgi:hypothetical protein